jgi:hypothetical protein
MSKIIAIAVAAVTLAACGESLPDPSMGTCTVTRDGKTLYVNSGYSCGDPSKATSGVGGDGGAGSAGK